MIFVYDSDGWESDWRRKDFENLLRLQDAYAFIQSFPDKLRDLLVNQYNESENS